ncbi:hypothetical protein ACQCVP_06950 [Rossellomorea vietnamensis]|uniref:hypothetical protein n=1 Tax=Rossellomorea vietnamensis TaxID=218284 RepID=UPI003CECD62C
MKKLVRAVLLIFFLFFGFITLRFGSALTQEGNPAPYLAAIGQHELSNNGYEEVLRTSTRIRYISKFEDKYPLGMAREYMETLGWEFKEQIGSGLMFEKGGDAITIETRQYSKHYYIWDIPKEILN